MDCRRGSSGSVGRARESKGPAVTLLISAVLALQIGGPVAQTEASNSDGRQLPVPLLAGAAATPANRGNFRSPDRRVWCGGVAAGSASCVSTGGPLRKDGNPTRDGPDYSARLSSRGKVTTCEVEAPSFDELCYQNWDPNAPILARGRRVEIDGVRCESTRNGIVCIRLRGPRRGYGFRINDHEAVKIKRHLGARRLAIPTMRATRSSSRPAASPPAVAPGLRSREAAAWFSLAAATRSTPTARAGSRSR